jgi:tight adherence protein B
MVLVVFAMTFLAVAILLLALWLLLGSETAQEGLRRRVEAFRKAEQEGQVSPDLKLIRDEMYSGVPLLHRLMLRLSWTGRLQAFITQAGAGTRPATFLLLSGVAGISTYILVSFAYHLTLVPIGIGLAAAMIPMAVIAFRRHRRLRQVEESFPEALDLLGRAVRAGHAFTTGLEMVSKESPEPLASEFRTTFEEQKFGLPLRDALISMTDRVPLVDVRFFVTAILVQKETGGNLAEILDELARVIRDRFRIYREVQVKTAQGRLSAIILIALPLVMLVALEVTNPSYVGVLFSDPLGPTILGIAASLQVIGSLVIWRVVHIKV